MARSKNKGRRRTLNQSDFKTIVETADAPSPPPAQAPQPSKQPKQTQNNKKQKAPGTPVKVKKPQQPAAEPPKTQPTAPKEGEGKKKKRNKRRASLTSKGVKDAITEATQKPASVQPQTTDSKRSSTAGASSIVTPPPAILAAPVSIPKLASMPPPPSPQKQALIHQVKTLQEQNESLVKEAKVSRTTASELEVTLKGEKEKIAAIAREQEKIQYEKQKLAEEKNQALLEKSQTAEENRKLTAEKQKLEGEVTNLRSQVRRLSLGFIDGVLLDGSPSPSGSPIGSDKHDLPGVCSPSPAKKQSQNQKLPTPVFNRRHSLGGFALRTPATPVVQTPEVKKKLLSSPEPSNKKQKLTHTPINRDQPELCSVPSPPLSDGGYGCAPVVYNEPGNQAKRNQYAACLEQQMAEQNKKKKVQKAQSLEDTGEYFPFGRPGGGAPIRDAKANVVTNLTYTRNSRCMPV